MVLTTFSDLQQSTSLPAAVVVFLCSLTAVFAIFSVAVASTLIVVTLKGIFLFIADIIIFVGELCAAVVAAITSGVTVTLTVILAAGAASFTFSASRIEARIAVAIAVSTAGIMSAACALAIFSSINIDLEVASAVISAAAVSVAFASAWAVGIMSLIEKETHQVGLKMTSLLDAVRHNNHRILRLLVKIQPLAKRRDLDLCLLHAVKAGFPECIEVLLSAGANVNTKDGYDNTPLILACETGSNSVVARLLDAGASIDARNGGRSTALHHAAKWGYTDCMAVLLQRGANYDLQDALWRTPLMLAAKHAQEPDRVLRVLIDAGCDVNLKGGEQRTALHYAASRGLDVRTLLEAGAYPNEQDSEGNTPLHCAADEGQLEVTRSLLKAGCSPNTLNFQRRNVLHLAAIKGSVECLKVLVEAGGEFKTVDNSDNLPIWYSALNNHIHATVYLIQQNCLVGPFKGQTSAAGASNPLVAALNKRHLTIARALVLGGCDCKPLFDWLMEISPSAWTEENATDLFWLKARLEHMHPPTLAHNCCNSIRHLLGRKVQENALHLPLPTKIKDMISMKELEELCDETT